MSHEIEKLPRLIELAANALSKATTAGEVLEAKQAAGAAYDAGKIAERLAKYKKAHEEVIAAIRRTQADALVIEARAQCRLADEYDAAQERGEVAKQGELGRGRSSKQELLSTAADIGITKKEVHEARQIRNAEKAKPGLIRKMLDKQLEDGEEPTRADVRRVIKNATPLEKKTPRTHRAPQTHYTETEIVALADKGMTIAQIAAETGIGQRQVRHVVEREQIRREAKAEPDIAPADLSMSAQEKLDSAIRQHKRKLDLEFEKRVVDGIRERMDEIILPHWKKQIEQAKTLYEKRKALMDKETFNTIRRALHPDSRNAISDKKLGDAFDAFMALEKYLLNEKESPTPFGDIPSTAAEWDKMRRQKTMRPTATNSIRPRS